MSITLTTSNSILLQNLITTGLILFPLKKQFAQINNNNNIFFLNTVGFKANVAYGAV